MRQIRMLRAMRRELETGLRRLLHGHAGGNPGHGQGAAYGLPRQFPTLPPSKRNRCGPAVAARQLGAVAYENRRPRSDFAGKVPMPRERAAAQMASGNGFPSTE